MEKNRIKAAIEAILFTMGEAISADKLADALSVDEKEVKAALDEMMVDYDETNRGIKLIELEESYQLCTKADYYEQIIKLANKPKRNVLTDVMLETLSIIAYKQPVTKSEIEKIRGVSSDHAVNKLLDYDLIEELGRLDAPGRPLLFGTTKQFLRCFGVSSLDELPTLGEDIIEEFRKQAEEETNVPLDI